ncbi:MAG: DUF3841 domain-containing protein [Synergistaceae bacterium]|nr:DUF3841 domain-containing protein [Synergistaceae bacterium]
MILWSIQPEKIFTLIQDSGVYRCDPVKARVSSMYPVQYDWLVSQMKKRVGPPPEGVSYPVWAYQRWQGERMRPDLRALRWYWGIRGEKLYRLELEIPDSQVLLSDFDAWIIILNEGLLADTEEEDDELYRIYDSLPPEAQKEMRADNWERVFDLTPVNTEWMIRGGTVQATFWELRKEYIREVTSFTSNSKYA